MRTDARIFRAASPLGLGRCWLGGGGCWLCGQTHTRPVRSPPLSPGRGPPVPILLPPETNCCSECWPGWRREKMADTPLGLQSPWGLAAAQGSLRLGSSPVLPRRPGDWGHTPLCTVPQTLPHVPRERSG